MEVGDIVHDHAVGRNGIILSKTVCAWKVNWFYVFYGDGSIEQARANELSILSCKALRNDV